ncbi:hypothetical protein BD410DRAFT_193462 [Rickenella mellea]|uniref:CUE domain-containing protein n=1 Tax=Rickenella mellea TaxID=50990 RepID=A0A4Y7Q5U3_9AGAM|nr:hypothetical protein BD410DRAFT_193462 [Rickenella mellea]
MAKLTELKSLPSFPSTKTLHSLSPSNYATLIKKISSALEEILSLPNDKLAATSCRDFVSSYAKDGAFEVLSVLVHGGEQGERSRDETIIRKRALTLAERLVTTRNAGGLDLQVMMDLCIVYGPKNSSRMRDVFQNALKSNSTILKELKDHGASAFQRLLDATDSGLHGLRKTTFCLQCLLQCAPPDVVAIFAQSKSFVLALARCYDARLSSIAVSYGGLHLERASTERDSWESQWVSCKVAIIDCFHVILQHILVGVHSGSQIEYAFDLIFALLDLPSPSTNESTPFLNRPLVVDYQHAYHLSDSLAALLANRDDPRLDVLDGTLRSFDNVGSNNSHPEGALKLLLRSSGIARGFDNRGIGKGKAKAKAADVHEEHDPLVDLAVSQVLDLFPDQSPSYIRQLLYLPRYENNPELVISALLEGEAPSPETLGQIGADKIKDQPASGTANATTYEYTKNRLNVFDDEQIDLNSVSIGKRNTDADAVLQDKTFISQMKADILRRAEDFSDDEDEGQTRGHVRTVAFEEELDDDVAGHSSRVSIAGDGERSGESHDEDDEDDAEDANPSPETILELAYIRDPKLFDRDAATRRSKARADLKAQTGWGDEQIEGWRIMLERNPKKDRILAKHEFSGNRAAGLQPHVPVGNAGPSGAGPSRGRGRGRGRGMGRGGRGGGSGGAGGENDGGGDARAKAWKDKNKARQGNHNRKRGHDKKMARAGGAPAL